MASLRNANRKEYSAWYNMIRRCYKEGLDNQEWYYDKGITVCPEWLDSFERFFEDMGKAPSKAHSLDREHSAPVYSKDTCKWSTQKEQTLNRGGFNVRHTLFGETLCLSEWCERYDLPRRVVLHRLNYKKWDIEKAITTPYVQKQFVQQVVDTVTGVVLRSVNRAAKVIGIPQPTLWLMLKGKQPNTTTFILLEDFKANKTKQLQLF